MAGTSLLFLAALWTSMVNADVSNSLEETITRNPPTNISISHGGLGEYTLSWEGNCTCKGKIYYQLNYTYLDSKDNEMERYFVQENQKALDFELHRGLLARVRLTYGDNLEITSNWTERTFDLSGELFAPVDNLTCIFYGDAYYMNCSWDVTENASEDAQFLLSYRERNPSEVYNCTDYLVDGGRNIGCVNHKMRIDDTTKIIICISEVNKKDKLPYCRIMNPYSFFKRNPPTNISISHTSLGEYTLSWEGNCKCNGKTGCQIDFTYLDSKDNKMETKFVHENQKALDFELHRGLLVRMRLACGDNLEITSNWTERTFDLSGELFAPVDNLTCIFYGDAYYMNCSWDVTENASEDAQFLLSYRERNPSEVYNCTDYLVDGGRNIGCVNHKMRSVDTTKIIICINEVNKKDKLPYCGIMNPYSSYKLDSPIYVTITKSTEEVEWTLPNFYLNTNCYNFQLNITNLNERSTKLENVTSTNHVISRDNTKKYSVHVRAVVNDNCGESHIWSDWSKPLIIDPDGKDMSFLTIVAVFAVILVAFVLLLVFVCIKCKLLSKLCQPIPDAEEKFKGLFEECNGDFQKWINKSIQVTNKAEDSSLITANKFQQP